MKIVLNQCLHQANCANLPVFVLQAIVQQVYVCSLQTPLSADECVYSWLAWGMEYRNIGGRSHRVRRCQGHPPANQR